MRKAVVLLSGLAILLSGCTSNSSESSPETNQKQDSMQQEISFSGLGETSGTEKATFAGSYKVNWKTEGNCYYSGDLKGGELASFDYINAFSVQDPAEGTSNLYDIPAGQYFLKVITGPTPMCPWSVTFIPTD
jgi:hypothetical protein